MSPASINLVSLDYRSLLVLFETTLLVLQHLIGSGFDWHRLR